MRICVVPPAGVYIEDSSHWRALLDGLRATEHEVQVSGTLQQSCDALVAINDSAQARRIQQTHSISPKRSALILLEPRVTSPRSYTSPNLVRYSHRYAASPMWAEAINGNSFNWPQDLSPLLLQRKRNDFSATLINAEKRSAMSGSLYGLRREVVREADVLGLRIAVFGPGWGSGRFPRVKAASRSVLKAAISGSRPFLKEAYGQISIQPSHWMGIVENKESAFSYAPSSVIIENSRDYVSEKLIDAIRCGVAPFYVGPQLSAFDMPRDIAIECEANADQILKSVTNATSDQIQEAIEAGEVWLTSTESKRHEIRYVLQTLGHRIGVELR